VEVRGTSGTASPSSIPPRPRPGPTRTSVSSSSSSAAIETAPILALAALATLRSSLVSAKTRREEAARRRLEEEEASPLPPQAGALPVIDVPSVLANAKCDEVAGTGHRRLGAYVESRHQGRGRTCGEIEGAESGIGGEGGEVERAVDRAAEGR